MQFPPPEKHPHTCQLVWLLAATLLATPVAAGEVVNGIAARVGHTLILWSEVVQAARGARLNTLSEGSAGAVRERLVEDVIVADEAKSLGRQIGETEILKAIDRFAASNGLDREQLRQMVTRQGTTWAAYQEIVRAQLLRAEVVQSRVRQTVVVTESDIENAYRATYQGQVQTFLVLQADDGEQMELGWVDPAEVRPEVSKAIAAYLSGSPNGSHSLQVGQKTFRILLQSQRVQGGPPLEEVHDALYETLFQERLDQAFQSWISRSKARYHIERMPVPASIEKQVAAAQQAL